MANLPIQNNHDITVAICLYNCEEYIEETLLSIINQTYQEFDLLIYNDCSTDNSVKIIKSFFQKHNRNYKLVNGNENKGLAYGRHFVESQSNTKYILFIDADDCPKPEMVEKLYNKIVNDSDLIAVGCHHEFIDSSSKKIGGGIFIGCKNKNEFYEKAKNNKLIFMQPTAIIDRDALISCGGRNIVGFPDGMPRYQDLCEDLDLWTRMSDLYEQGKAIIVIPEILSSYRKHSNALSNNTFGMFLRMKHIKNNLLRRRDGYEDLTFIDFYDSLTDLEHIALQKKTNSANYFRKSINSLKNLNIIAFVFFLTKSFISDKTYIFQKIVANSGIFK